MLYILNISTFENMGNNMWAIVKSGFRAIGVVTGVSVVLLSSGMGQAFAATSTQSIALPVYEYPTLTNLWPSVTSAGGAHVPFVVVNPASGPGGSANSDYTSRIATNTTQGIRSIGYVDTNYQARSVSSVLTDIDGWYSLYPGISGIMFDRVGTGSAADVCYSSYIYNYTKTKHPSSLIVDNFGTYASPAYEPYSDIIINAEMDNALYQTWVTPADGFQNNPAYSNRFLHIIHTSLSSDLAATLALTRAHNAGWVYITDDTLPNPYDTAPTYWSTLLTSVATLPASTIPNRGVTQLPSGCLDVSNTVNSTTAVQSQKTVTSSAVTLANTSTLLAAQTPTKIHLTMPSGVSLQNASGTGWSCAANDCTYNTLIAPSASAPVLTADFAVSCDYSSGQATVTSHTFTDNQIVRNVALTRPADCPVAAVVSTSTTPTLANTGVDISAISYAALALTSLAIAVFLSGRMHIRLSRTKPFISVKPRTKYSR